MKKGWRKIGFVAIMLGGFLFFLTTELWGMSASKVTLEDKIVKVDGQIFNPKGMWNPVLPGDNLEENLRKVSQQGFNFVLVKNSPRLYSAYCLSILNTAQELRARVSKRGYQSLRKNVSIGPGQTKEANFVLRKR
jgi:hypothetical protein